MLQIISGKLFSNAPGQVNQLAGVLYTNANLWSSDEVVTAAGTISPLSYLRGNRAFYYKVEEKIEAGPGAGVIYSFGIEQIITEFSAIVSFALNVLCTPNANLLERLLEDGPRVGVIKPPRKYINRVFDPQITISKKDEEFLIRFTQKLLDLPREKYQVAIRAIRTYVTATHRVSDDLEISYTLFVASIEALAQKFDGHMAEWEDYEQGKRAQIDKALKGSSDETMQKVRGAILKIEHTALSRRFRDFSIKYLPGSFFDGADIVSPFPLGRIDLNETLKHAYGIRSKYMHELLQLPEDLKHIDDGSEVAIIDNRTLLTFQGLSRLAREVIIQFVNDQEVMKVESYDYRMEVPGVKMLQLDPKYWITDPGAVDVTNGKVFLGAFLNIVGQQYCSPEVPRLINISEVVKAAIRKFPNMSEAQKRPFAVLHRVWNAVCGRDEHKVAIELESDSAYIELTEGPSIESLAAHAVLGSDTEWSQEDHHRIFKSYFTKREIKDAMRFPRNTEACICLAYAERLRRLGKYEEARAQLVSTAESYVAFSQIRSFIESYDEALPIEWVPIIYPDTKPRTALPTE